MSSAEMTYGTKREGYAGASKFLHWLTALCIFIVLPAGIILEDLPEGPIQNLGYDLHRSFGFVILCLAVMRIAVRLFYGAPAAYAGLTPFERRASAAVHHALYLLVFLTPLLGWAATSAYPVKISVFWLFDLPPLAPANEALSKILFKAHTIAAFSMAALLVAHIGGALMHRFVKRDGVLDRMLPERRV
jgi:cytochrome b561